MCVRASRATLLRGGLCISRLELLLLKKSSFEIRRLFASSFLLMLIAIRAQLNHMSFDFEDLAVRGFEV